MTSWSRGMCSTTGLQPPSNISLRWLYYSSRIYKKIAGLESGTSTLAIELKRRNISMLVRIQPLRQKPHSFLFLASWLVSLVSEGPQFESGFENSVENWTITIPRQISASLISSGFLLFLANPAASWQARLASALSPLLILAMPRLTRKVGRSVDSVSRPSLTALEK